MVSAGCGPLEKGTYKPGMRLARLEGLDLQKSLEVGPVVLAGFARICCGRPGAQAWLEGAEHRSTDWTVSTLGGEYSSCSCSHRCLCI